ncbi:hypothetical protein ABW02_01355 [Niallia circulans]|uniref:Uncharacterized protein n=1 Tax=Niallia circulans TaxID=1397 RepID=A0A0J1IR30_NIACI|nr:hypothetical protein ABW02_01355 [Niallia circulans]
MYLSGILTLVVVLFILPLNQSKSENSNSKKIKPTTYNNRFGEIKPIISEAHAKTDSYENLALLIEDSPLIVRSIKVFEEEPSLIRDEEGYLMNEFTISSFKITKIYKNTTNKELNQNNTIKISEFSTLDKENNILYQINEYELMEKNEQYILFLRPSTDVNADHYFTKGITFGKVGVKNEDKKLDS